MLVAVLVAGCGYASGTSPQERYLVLAEATCAQSFAQRVTASPPIEELEARYPKLRHGELIQMQSFGLSTIYSGAVEAATDEQERQLQVVSCLNSKYDPFHQVNAAPTPSPRP